MSDKPNRRIAAEGSQITGNEPSLRRLYEQLETMREAEETGEAERSEIETLQAQIASLMEDIRVLEGRVREHFQTRFERTGYVYDVRPREHDRAHPEIVKHSVCQLCGQSFSYQIYATGWTRTICETCRPAHRREQLRNAQRRRREQQRMNLENGE